MTSMDPEERAPGRNPPYPVQTIRHRYETVLGGVTDELQPWQVGVNRTALQANTDLVPQQDQVHVLENPPEKPRPLLTREVYTLVALDGSHPAALELSPNGEAVFSAHALDEITLDHPMAEAERGMRLVINATLSRRWGGNAREWFEGLVESAFADPGPRRS